MFDCKVYLTRYNDTKACFYVSLPEIPQNEDVYFITKNEQEIKVKVYDIKKVLNMQQLPPTMPGRASFRFDIYCKEVVEEYDDTEEYENKADIDLIANPFNI